MKHSGPSRTGTLLPSSHIMRFKKVSRRVFANPRYFLVAVVAGAGLLLSLSLLPHLTLLSSVWLSSSIPVTEKFSLLAHLIATLGVNTTVVGKSVVVLTSMLFGLQTAFLLYYIRRRQTATTQPIAEVASLSGIVAALFGIGCAACGSVILTAVLGLVGGIGLLSVLPFHGMEFGIFGVAVLAFTIGYLVKKIDDPMICPV